MGQTPSIVDIPDEWGEILAHLSVDDIARCSRERVSQERDTVYLNGRVFDMDERTVDLCVAILDAHAHLNGTRFQLVPGRMTEERFWAALFGCLTNEENGNDDDCETEIDDSFEVDVVEERKPPCSPQSRMGTRRSPIANLEKLYEQSENGHGSLQESRSDFIRLIQEQQAHIDRLERSLREANHQQRKMAIELQNLKGNMTQIPIQQLQTANTYETPKGDQSVAALDMGETRSLLNLAAENDRVDVIKDLLNDQPHNVVKDMLAGVSIESTSVKDAKFSPPLLHIAVKCGAVNAATCLLRMGADPSIRPIVPAPFMSSSYTPRRSAKRSESGMVVEEDQDYRKFHKMTAYELAFGTNNNASTTEAPPSWFGFSTPKNTATRNLEGLRHAFSAEVLRALGSDEADRLQQLFDSGLEVDAKIGDKPLAKWADELESVNCIHVIKDMTS